MQRLPHYCHLRCSEFHQNIAAHHHNSEKYSQVLFPLGKVISYRALGAQKMAQRREKERPLWGNLEVSIQAERLFSYHFPRPLYPTHQGFYFCPSIF